MRISQTLNSASIFQSGLRLCQSEVQTQNLVGASYQDTITHNDRGRPARILDTQSITLIFAEIPFGDHLKLLRVDSENLHQTSLFKQHEMLAEPGN